MQKCSKLGISVALLSMLCYFAGYYNFTACAILFAVVLIYSQNKDLRVNATQAIVFSALFTVVTGILSQFSDVIYDIIYYFAGMFNTFKATPVSDFFYGVANWVSTFDLVRFCNNVLHLLYFIFTVIFVFGSLKGKVCKVPFITKLVEKHFDESESTADVE